MQCKICGTNLVRGFTFCLECGTPVPPEMLEESGLPDRNTDHGPQEIETPKTSKSAEAPQTEEPVGDLQPKLIGGDQDRGEALKPQLFGGDAYEKGKALKPKLMGLDAEEAGEALKPQLIGGEEQAGGGEKVRATLQDSSADASDTAVEKLVFCPNCGMHMQHNPNKCEICGMALENKPNYVPTTESGIPLFNTDPDPFSGTGGLGNFTGGFGSLSDEDVSRINNFSNGNTDPMFNSGSSSFNVQATPNDFSQLTEQLANFSTAAGMPTIEKTENTRIRQKAVPKGKDVEISDFSMSDDLTSETIPMGDRNVPVLGDHAMEDNPDEYINLDPFAFVGMSMDEDPPISEPNMEAAVPPEPIPAPQLAAPAPTPAPVLENIGPASIQPPSFADNAPKETVPEVTAPINTVEAPAPSVFAAPSFVGTERPEPPGPNTAAPTQTIRQVEPVQQAQPAQQPQEVQQPVQTVQQTQPAQQPQAVQQVQQAQPAQQPQPDETAQKFKKCYACGRSMPVKDKFCPNCGRSMFGGPNPNRMPNVPQPEPPRAKKKPVAAIVIVVIVLIAAVVAGIFLLSKKSEALCLGELSQTVSSTEQALLSDTVTENLIS